MIEKRAGRKRLIFGRIDLKRSRACMCCGQDFTSYGNHNRLCARCKCLESDYSCLGLDRSGR